jgi:hypothetical protein
MNADRLHLCPGGFLASAAVGPNGMAPPGCVAARRPNPTASTAQGTDDECNTWGLERSIDTFSRQPGGRSGNDLR